MTALEALRAGRERLAKGPWAQGGIVLNDRDRGYVCAVTALPTWEQSHARDHDLHAKCLCLLIAAAGLLPDVALSEYNDDPTTRKRDILRIYDRAIARLEAEETP